MLYTCVNAAKCHSGAMCPYAKGQVTPPDYPELCALDTGAGVTVQARHTLYAIIREGD